jgi:hypothetical protein
MARARLRLGRVLRIDVTWRSGEVTGAIRIRGLPS